ncbi:DUF374 domain-containing protein [Rhodobacterales bacterium HKCCE2091]|nr:DUF374 domain-containing protein [Rhodobacterales bacterium HKCCE2091]
MASTGKTRSLRQKIADWPPLTEGVAALLAGWLRLVRATSRIDEDGWDAVEAAIEEHGAAIIVFWHQRTFGAPIFFKTDRAPGRTINADTRAGRLGMAILRRFGFVTIGMRRGREGMAAMREALSGLASGVSIGLAVDGPSGPFRVAKPVAVQWARSSGKPIFITAYSSRRYSSWPTWDKFMFPMPFNRIAVVWRQWDAEIPRRATAEETEALNEALSRAIDAVTEDADRRVGHPGLMMHAPGRAT